MTETHSIKCPVCLNEFDATQRIPKIFPMCGHTICKECLTQVLEMNKPQCPLDKLNLSRDFRTAEAFPTNFLGKDLLQIDNLWSKCSTHHHESNKMICLTDHTLVCGDCVLFGDHKDHDVRLISDLLGQAKQKKEQLESISADISKNFPQLSSSLVEKQRNMTFIVKQRFQKLHEELNQQQADFLLELETAFTEERTRLNLLVNKSSQLTLKVRDKLKDFANLTSNPNIAKLVEEDFSDLKNTIDMEYKTILKKQTEEVPHICALLEDALPKEDLFRDLNLIGSLRRQLVQYNEKRNSEQKEQLDDTLDLFVELTLVYQPKTGVLVIENSPKKKLYNLKKSFLEKISGVCFELFFNGEMFLNPLLPVIKALSNYLVNVKSIEIEIDSKSQLKDLEMGFYRLMLASFSYPENLKSISVNVSGLSVKDAGPLYLLRDVIPKAKNLERFYCNFNQTKISSTVLRALTHAKFKDMQNLQQFRLNISDAIFDEEEIREFLLTIPNVKEIELTISSIRLSDQVLDDFSTKALHQLNNVHTLRVELGGNQITNTGVQKFMENLPNISRLQVSLNSLGISDGSLSSFFESKLVSLNKLTFLEIDTKDTSLSRHVKQQIREWKKLKEKKETQKALTNLIKDSPQPQTNIFSQLFSQSTPTSTSNGFLQNTQSNLFSQLSEMCSEVKNLKTAPSKDKQRAFT